VTEITFPDLKKWEYLLRYMKRISPLDQLLQLRASLEHFEQAPDFGDSEAVEVIRRHLEIRIREAEGALRCPPWLQMRGELEAA
jgi:hypothetical protein